MRVAKRVLVPGMILTLAIWPGLGRAEADPGPAKADSAVAQAEQRPDQVVGPAADAGGDVGGDV